MILDRVKKPRRVRLVIVLDECDVSLRGLRKLRGGDLSAWVYDRDAPSREDELGTIESIYASSLGDDDARAARAGRRTRQKRSK